MEPTIRVGDHMLVGKTQTNPRRDGIYVICWDGWINVKRVACPPIRRDGSSQSAATIRLIRQMRR